MTFDEAYQGLKVKGATAIPFKTNRAAVVDVWASELVSGPRRGQRVIRIQWANSSSTVNESQWLEPNTPLLRHLKLAISSATTQ